jgi:hypothetical protein
MIKVGKLAFMDASGVILDDSLVFSGLSFNLQLNRRLVKSYLHVESVSFDRAC